MSGRPRHSTRDIPRSTPARVSVLSTPSRVADGCSRWQLTDARTGCRRRRPVRTGRARRARAAARAAGARDRRSDGRRRGGSLRRRHRLRFVQGLALINGTQASTAVLAFALDGAETLARAADIAAALSIDGLRGPARPFDPRIHEVRPFAGQMASAASIRVLLQDSAINRSH